MPGETTFEMVRSLICREFDIDCQDISPATKLAEDLDLDSVDGVALVVRLEEETGIVLRDEELRSLKTVENVVDVVRHQLGRA